MPTELGRLTLMTYLTLHNNDDLRGTIVTELGELTRLTVLDIDYAGHSGTIPTQVSRHCIDCFVDGLSLCSWDV